MTRGATPVMSRSRERHGGGSGSGSGGGCGNGGAITTTRITGDMSIAAEEGGGGGEEGEKERVSHRRREALIGSGGEEIPHIGNLLSLVGEDGKYDIGSDDDARGKRRKKEKDKQRESELENVLFGSLYSPVTFGKEDSNKGLDEGSALFHVDRSAVRQVPDYEDEDDDDDDDDDEEKGQPEGIRKGGAACEDEEEQEININIAKVNRLRKLRKEENEGLISGSEYIPRLRAHHAKLNPGTDWARPDSQ